MKTSAQEPRKQSQPLDRLTPAKGAGFTPNGSDSFPSKLYIAIDGRSGIKARREILPRSAQFPSTPLDVEFVHRCLIQFAALTPLLLVFSSTGGGRGGYSTPRCCAHLVGCQAPLEGDKQTMAGLRAVRAG